MNQIPLADAGRVRFRIETSAFARSRGASILTGVVVVVEPDRGPDFPMAVPSLEELTSLCAAMRPAAVSVSALPLESTDAVWNAVRAAGLTKRSWTKRATDLLRGAR